MYEDVIANRQVGQYPLSIATSLAIEAANGIHPDIVVESAPLRQYQELWINARTLFRNLVGAFTPSDSWKLAPAQELAETLVGEMEQITRLVTCPIVYYLSNYQGLEQQYRQAVLRVDTTADQKLYTQLQTDTLAQLLQMHLPVQLLGFDLKLSSPRKNKTLLLTHVPYDLLSHRSFGELTLLESHTGAIKPRAQWYTKYLNGKELPPIPFREDLIQVFGDKETFRPMDPKLRRELIEIAKKYHWTPVTTYDKIFYGVERLQNPAHVLRMKQVLSRNY